MLKEQHIVTLLFLDFDITSIYILQFFSMANTLELINLA